jgi:rRNA-processing protein FCF1
VASMCKIFLALCIEDLELSTHTKGDERFVITRVVIRELITIAGAMKKTTGETSHALTQLLQRPCTCLRRVCFQQFSNCAEAVRAARRSLKELEPSQRVSCLWFESGFPGFEST